jgi:hypothetical protein
MGSWLAFVLCGDGFGSLLVARIRFLDLLPKWRFVSQADVDPCIASYRIARENGRKEQRK